MKATIRHTDIGGGNQPHTANYGACIIFTTVDGDKLQWDTMSRMIYDVDLKREYTISYKLIRDLGYIKEISHVRFQQSNVPEESKVNKP